MNRKQKLFLLYVVFPTALTPIIIYFMDLYVFKSLGWSYNIMFTLLMAVSDYRIYKKVIKKEGL